MSTPPEKMGVASQEGGVAALKALVQGLNEPSLAQRNKLFKNFLDCLQDKEEPFKLNEAQAKALAK